jgi:myosin heavy subunit
VESLCENLKVRHAADLIYTLCGTILVAVNPYKPLPIYSLDIMRKYKNKLIGSMPPHVFAVADQSFCDMREGKRSVSVIISGESGAGKTENTKLLLNYVSSLHNEQTVVEQRLIESASLLESFGNAKTVRNNNSSRFGKLIKILFSPQFRIAGAEIETYLLERSRVSHREEIERNFHVFYELAQGATSEDRARYSLDPKGAAAYSYTQGCLEIEGWFLCSFLFLFFKCCFVQVRMSLPSLLSSKTVWFCLDFQIKNDTSFSALLQRFCIWETLVLDTMPLVKSQL